MLRLAGGLDLAHGGRRRVAAFREDDVARHQRLAGREVIADALVDRGEFSHRRGRLVNGRQGAGPRRFAQRVQSVSRRLNRRARLAEPEGDALPRGDVRLLADPRVHERRAGVAGVLVEGAQRGCLLFDVLFGTDEEERRGTNDDQGKNATRQPQRA